MDYKKIIDDLITTMIREGKISAAEFGSQPSPRDRAPHEFDPRRIETWIGESLELFRVQALLVS